MSTSPSNRLGCGAGMVPRFICLVTRPCRHGGRAATTASDPAPVVHAFLLSLGVIFVAELGDKSQLMALAFSTRFSAWRVLAGITDRHRA